MSASKDVDYTFRDSPRFLSPRPDNHVDVDEDHEEVDPSDIVLNKITSKFSPKKTSIFDKISKRKVSLKRRRSKKVKSSKRSKSPKSPKRRKSRKRTKK